MDDQTSGCIEQIKRLGFKPGTQLSIFCKSCRESIKVFSDKLDEPENANFLNKHKGHKKSFGFNDGRRWRIQDDASVEVDKSHKIEPTIETKILNTEKKEVSPSLIQPKQEIPIETPQTESTNLSEGANPQAEDGHVDIANEIVEALAKTNLSPYESRILWALWRKTYGWHKKEDKIALTTFQEMTGLPRRNVTRILFKLVQRKIINKKDDTFIRSYSFQKDYTKWQNRGNSGPIGAKLPLPPKIGAKQMIKLSSKLPPSKEKKERYYVEGSEPLRLASLLLEEIKKNKPDFKEPNLQVWANDIDLMMRRDKRSAENIERVIKWAQADHGDGTGRWKGWASNILSPGKLREKFDELELKMRETDGRKPKSSW
jgi:phage replication O-like protein O